MYKAQTLCFLFGNSGRATTDSAQEIRQVAERKPYFHLAPKDSHYWMQTGETYRFDYEAAGTSDRVLRIFENQRHVETLEPDATGGFAYKPSHDPDLDTSGYQAYKEVVLLIEESTGQSEYASTFTMVLHRSRYGNQKLLPGIALFFLTGTLVALAVIHTRRRFPY